jgi:transposase
MTNTELFSAALGLQGPWKVSNISFQPNGSELELHIEIGYFRTDGSVAIYDHVNRRWQHLNFFQHRCFIHCSVPRIQEADGKVKTLEVPWSRPGSGFSLLFEAFALSLLQHGMSMSKTGLMMSVDGKLICRILRHYVDKATEQEPLSPVEKLGIDETSISKGHNYMTVAVDLVEKKVIGISEGRDEFALGVALGEAELRGADLQRTKAVAMDLSPAYTAAVHNLLPEAQIVYDRFHLEQMISKAVDEVRKIEREQNNDLRKCKYILLRNRSDLKTDQLEKLHYITETFPTIGKVYQLKEQFKEIWRNEKEDAKEAFHKWMEMAQNSQIYPLIRVVNSFKSHMTGIISYFDHLITSGFVERVNLTIQEIKRIAKGYRNFGNYRAMIFLRLGKLQTIPHYK